MSLWVNIVKRRLVLQNNQVKNLVRTERYGAFIDIARNYRLLEIQLAIQQVITNSI